MSRGAEGNSARATLRGSQSTGYINSSRVSRVGGATEATDLFEFEAVPTVRAAAKAEGELLDMRSRQRCVSGVMLVSFATRIVGAFNMNPTISGGLSRGLDKSNFYDALDRPFELNEGSDERNALLKSVIESEEGIQNPGRDFQSVAPGRWRVCYAPHMTFMAGLFGGSFDVQYDLGKDGTMTSHAKYDFPLLNLFGYLSVSGTYGSVDEEICRVDFDEAWIAMDQDAPFETVDDVPDSFSKSIIRKIGRLLFIEAWSVFPVSYLDDDLIVFDFELLGTRICARKQP